MGTAPRAKSPADKRAQFIEPASPRWRLTPAIAIGATVLLLVAALAFSFVRGSAPNAFVSSSAVHATAGDDVVLTVSTFDDGQARFYTYVTAAQRTVRFFVMKSADGVLRAAFDACDVCFREKRGYRQAGDLMVCNNCEQTFPSNGINVLQGGCNPVPLERSVSNGQVVLPAQALALGAVYF
jgi:uncharacterized membrane protein